MLLNLSARKTKKKRIKSRIIFKGATEKLSKNLRNKKRINNEQLNAYW